MGVNFTASLIESRLVSLVYIGATVVSDRLKYNFQADRMLMEAGEGAFLVRESKRSQDAFTLCMLFDGRVLNYKAIISLFECFCKFTRILFAQNILKLVLWHPFLP